MHGHAAVGQDALRALRVEGQRVAGREHLDGERLALGLARLAADHRDELVLPLEQHAHRAPQIAAALLDRQRAPLGLRLARHLERALDVGLAARLELADELERGGAAKLVATPRACGGLERLQDGHAASCLPSHSARPLRLGAEERVEGTGAPREMSIGSDCGLAPNVRIEAP